MQPAFKLSYNKTQDPWPLAATAERVVFSFSGTFDVNRIQKENILQKSLATLKTILTIIAGISLVAFALSAYTGLTQNYLIFLFTHNFYNLIFWLCAPADCYFWALTVEAKRNNEGRNLLAWKVIQDKSQAAGKVDLYDFYDKQAKQAWNGALAIAKKRGQAEPGVVDVFISLCQQPSIKLFWARLGYRAQDIQSMLEAAVKQSEPSPDTRLEELPYIALTEAMKLHNKNIDAPMLLCALAVATAESHPLQKLFFKLDISLDKLETVATWIFNVELLRQELSSFRRLSVFRSDNEINKGFTSVPTPYLDKFSRDLTLLAKYGQLPIAQGREQDLEALFGLLSEGKKDIILKGMEGTGRTTIVHELAYRMVTEQVPKSLQDKRLVKLELSAILGSNVPSEQALVHCLQESERSGNIVLVLEELHALGHSQSSQGLALLEVLVHHLEQSSLMVIATTTPNNYLDYLHSSANFDQVFTMYELKDLSHKGIILSCCIRASLLESQHQVFFLYQAIEEAVTLTDQFYKDMGQPQKSIEVLSEAAIKVKNSSEDGKVVTSETVQQLMAEKTHVPQETFTQNEADKLLNLEQAMRAYVVGQTQAVQAVAEGIRRARSGLSGGTRPIGSFLFVGPTGVGKTEVARTLSKVYFGAEQYLLRLDMSEYQGSDGVDKLLGFQGDDTDTMFVKHLKNYPFCLFLLDEFEKASRQVLNLFLQILEDGRLTTTKGETLDLSHTIIIATSNAGTKNIQEGLMAGKGLEEIRTNLFNTVLLEHFAPELLNRFDSIVLFTPLSPEEIKQITALQLGQLSKQILEKNIKLSFSDAVIAEVALKGFDPLLGARPIRRYIQDHVENVIAKLLLSKQLNKGSEVTLDLENGEFVVR